MRVWLISLAGFALFLWPFFGLGGLPDAPAMTLMGGSVAGLLMVEAGLRGLDARRLALLAVLSAIDAGLRLAVVEGIGGFSPVYFGVLCAGFVFGPSYGFVVGALSILVSAVAEGGIGPWLPYQVFTTGWVGVAAGLAGIALGRIRGPRWLPVATLAAVGLLSGWPVGALLDVQTWVAGYRGVPRLGWVPGMGPEAALGNFARFYLATSLLYDSFRSAGNLLMVALFGAPVVAALERVRARLSFEVVRTP
jgi:energy-coupling factor transport system substrate-specific component